MSEDLQTNIGRVVRRRRREHGYSQEAFATVVGIHRTYMGDVERGKRNISVQNLIKVARGLGIPLSVLIAEAEQGDEVEERTYDPVSELVRVVSALHPAQVRLLIDMAQVMRRPVAEDVNLDSDIVTESFAASFRNLLLIHHATNEAKLTKKPFEYAFQSASKASGRDARIVVSQTNPGIDVIVEGVGYSLKTEAAIGLNPNIITISKLCEARWIQQCNSLDELAVISVDRVVRHLRQYQRIIVLRSWNTTPQQVQYSLVEIPREVLLSISTLTTESFSPRTAQGGSTGRVLINSRGAFTLWLDGSDGKITISGLRIDLCIRHATWIIPLTLPEGEVDGS